MILFFLFLFPFLSFHFNNSALVLYRYVRQVNTPVSRTILSHHITFKLETLPCLLSDFASCYLDYTIREKCCSRIRSLLAAPHGALEKASLPEAKAFTPSRDTYD